MRRICTHKHNISLKYSRNHFRRTGTIKYPIKSNRWYSNGPENTSEGSALFRKIFMRELQNLHADILEGKYDVPKEGEYKAFGTAKEHHSKKKAKHQRSGSSKHKEQRKAQSKSSSPSSETSSDQNQSKNQQNQSSSSTTSKTQLKKEESEINTNGTESKEQKKGNQEPQRQQSKESTPPQQNQSQQNQDRSQQQNVGTLEKQKEQETQQKQKEQGQSREQQKSNEQKSNEQKSNEQKSNEQKSNEQKSNEQKSKQQEKQSTNEEIQESDNLNEESQKRSRKQKQKDKRRKKEQKQEKQEKQEQEKQKKQPEQKKVSQEQQKQEQKKETQQKQQQKQEEKQKQKHQEKQKQQEKKEQQQPQKSQSESSANQNQKSTTPQSSSTSSKNQNGAENYSNTNQNLQESKNDEIKNNNKINNKNNNTTDKSNLNNSNDNSTPQSYSTTSSSTIDQDQSTSNINKKENETKINTTKNKDSSTTSTSRSTSTKSSTTSSTSSTTSSSRSNSNSTLGENKSQEDKIAKEVQQILHSFEQLPRPALTERVRLISQALPPESISSANINTIAFAQQLISASDSTLGLHRKFQVYAGILSRMEELSILSTALQQLKFREAPPRARWKWCEVVTLIGEHSRQGMRQALKVMRVWNSINPSHGNTVAGMVLWKFFKANIYSENLSANHIRDALIVLPYPSLPHVSFKNRAVNIASIMHIGHILLKSAVNDKCNASQIQVVMNAIISMLNFPLQTCDLVGAIVLMRRKVSLPLDSNSDMIKSIRGINELLRSHLDSSHPIFQTWKILSLVFTDSYDSSFSFFTRLQPQDQQNIFRCGTVAASVCAWELNKTSALSTVKQKEDIFVPYETWQRLQNNLNNEQQKQNKKK